MKKTTPEYRRQWRKKCLAEGRCGNCGRKNQSRYANCDICRKNNRNADKIQRAKRKEAGTCVACGKTRDMEGLLQCSKCLQDNRNRNASISNEQKRQYKKSQIDRWRASEMCINCGRERNVDGRVQCGKCLEAGRSYIERVGKEARRETQRRRTLKIKIDCFNQYGGCICACCRESIMDFLTLDHIDRNGAEERKCLKKQGIAVVGTNFYRYLRRSGYPNGYQVLCYNCNIGRERHNGVCPHKL